MPTFNSPKRIELIESQLYITDNDSIRVIDTTTFTEDDVFKIDNSISLYDICYDGDSLIYLTDDSVTKIFTFFETSPRNPSYINLDFTPSSLHVTSDSSFVTLMKNDTVNKIYLLDKNSKSITDTLNLNLGDIRKIEQDYLGSYYFISDDYSLRALGGLIDSLQTFYYGYYQLVGADLKNDTLHLLDFNQDSIIRIGVKELSEPYILQPDSSIMDSRFNINLEYAEINLQEVYQIQVTDQIDFTSILMDTLINNNYFIIDSLIRDSLFQWRYRGINRYDSTSWSDTSHFEITSLNKLSITNLTNDTTFAGNKFDVVWDDSIGTFEYEYKLEFTIDSIYNKVLVKNDTIESNERYYFDSTYYLRVRKVDTYEFGEWSDSLIVNTGTIYKPTIISPINNLDSVDLTTVFNWLGYGSGSFRIQIGIDSLFSPLLYNSTLIDTTLTNLSISNRDDLYWRVRTEYKEQFSEWSDTLSFSSIIAPPNIISPKADTKNVSRVPEFIWDESKFSYEVEIYNYGDTIPIHDFTADSVSFQTGIWLDTGHYEWKIRTKRIIDSNTIIFSEWNSESFRVDTLTETKFKPVVGGYNEFFSFDSPSIILSEHLSTTTANNDMNDFILTAEEVEQIGIVYYDDQLDFSKDFQIECYLNFGKKDANGGNGIALVFQELGAFYLVDSSFISFGYTDYINSTNVAAIEFDTYNNYLDLGSDAAIEPDIINNSWDVDHISFHIGGSKTPETGSLSGDFYNRYTFVNAKKNTLNIEDGETHCIYIEWEATMTPNPSGTLKVTFDGELRNTYNVSTSDLATFTTNEIKCYFQISSTTGPSSNNIQKVKEVKITR